MLDIFVTHTNDESIIYSVYDVYVGLKIQLHYIQFRTIL